MTSEILHWEPTGDVEVVRLKSGGCESTTHPLQHALSSYNDACPTVFFIEAKKSKTSMNAAATKALSAKFAIPKRFWYTKQQDSNGFFYGRSLRPSKQGAPRRHVTVFRFMIKYVTRWTESSTGPIPNISYDWHILTFVTYWEPGVKSTMLCFNAPPGLKDMIRLSLDDESLEDLSAHPFALQAIVLEHVAELYDTAIWQFRDFVRDTERQRLPVEDPRPDYIAMHELARHVMHSSEVLSTALNVVDHMISEMSRYSPSDPDDYDPGPAIRYQKSMLQFMENRSKALEGRLKNEINLALHITAQHTNMINAQIAHAAQVDSRAMKTISVLGLVFLPGTFISAIFSMSFFNFTQATADQPARWAVSEKFWVYWVVAIPVTLITVGVWWAWQEWQGRGLPPAPVAQTNKLKKERC